METKEILVDNLRESLNQSQRFMVIAFGASIFSVLLAFGTPGDINAPIGPVAISVGKPVAIALSLTVFGMAGLIASVGVSRVKTIIALLDDPDLVIAFVTYPSILTIRPPFLRHFTTLVPPVLAVATLWQMFGKQLLGGTWQFVGILLLFLAAIAPHLSLALELHKAVGESVRDKRAIERVCAKEMTATGVIITPEQCEVLRDTNSDTEAFVRVKTNEGITYYLVTHGRDFVVKLTAKQAQKFHLK